MENEGRKIEKRFSEQELAMKRTTLPLHSFLGLDELSVYYVLDRMPVRSPLGIGDQKAVRTVARIAGFEVGRAQRAIDGLVALGLVREPGTDTTMAESVIRFSEVYALCKKLGDYPVGFGKYLRKWSGDTAACEIAPGTFLAAMKDMMDDMGG